MRARLYARNALALMHPFSVPRRAHGIDSILPSSHSVCFQKLQDCCNFTASGVKMSHASRRVCDHVTNFNAYCPYTCKGGDHLGVTQIATQLPCFTKSNCQPLILLSSPGIINRGTVTMGIIGRHNHFDAYLCHRNKPDVSEYIYVVSVLMY